MQMRGGVERGLIRCAVLGKRMFVKKVGHAVAIMTSRGSWLTSPRGRRRG